MAGQRALALPAFRSIFLAMLVLLSLVVSAAELWRLMERHQALQQRTRLNVDEARAANSAQALVALQGNAVLDLVLATTPDETDDASSRFEAVSRRCHDAQAALFALFDADGETTAAERAMLAQVRQEEARTERPVQRVLGLARQDQEASATRLLVEEALPHEVRLQQILSRLGALQYEQNRELERGSDPHSLEMDLVAALAALSALLAALRLQARRHLVRDDTPCAAQPGVPAHAATPTRGGWVPAGFMLVRATPATSAAASADDERLLGVSAGERARALA